MKHGMEGYGIYWSLVEMLRESGDYMLSLCDCNAIAYDLHCEEDKVLSIINDFSLFEISEKKQFWSKTLVERMRKWVEKSKIARKNALKRWESCKRDATALQSDAIKGKERKGKESKSLTPTKIKILDSITLAQEELDRLIKRYGKDKTKEYMNKLNEWKMAKGKKTASDYHTILTWARKDNVERKD